MSILASKLAHLVERLDQVSDVAPQFETELRQAYELATGFDPYLSEWSTPESPALRRLAQATSAHDWNSASLGTTLNLEQEMLSGHIEGQLLKVLVHATRAKRVLEVGMFTGYSALAMAEALPAEGEVVACEINADVAAFAQQCFAGSPSGAKITVKVGAALRTLGELAASGDIFDLVFIDADKAGYRDYFATVLDCGLLAPHGLICVDNTLMQGEPWLPSEMSRNAAAIAGFNEAVAADPRVEQVIIPLRDGLTLIRRVDGKS